MRPQNYAALLAAAFTTALPMNPFVLFWAKMDSKGADAYFWNQMTVCGNGEILLNSILITDKGS